MLEQFTKLTRDTRNTFLWIKFHQEIKKREVTVDVLSDSLGLSRDVVEGHLKILIDAGVIREAGTGVKYELALDVPIDELLEKHGEINIKDKEHIIELLGEKLTTPRELLDAGFYVSYLRNLLPNDSIKYAQAAIDKLAEDLRNGKTTIGFYLTDSVYSHIMSTYKEQTSDAKEK